MLDLDLIILAILYVELKLENNVYELILILVVGSTKVGVFDSKLKPNTSIFVD
jgi:hypothetical protein